MKPNGLLVLTALILFWGGFSPDPVTLNYAPSSAPAKTPSNIQLGTITDSRSTTDPTYLGEIRNGYGGHMKSLRTPDTVADEIRKAFEAGLKARGQLGTVRHRLDITVIRFDCNQYVRREAHAYFNFTLVDLATNKVEYANHVVVQKVQGSAFALDVAAFASVDDLRDVANDALREAVDDVLDDPGLRSHLT